MRAAVAILLLAAGLLEWSGCRTQYNAAERERNEAIFVSVAKAGMRFEDVQARLAAKGLGCGEPFDFDKRGQSRVSFVYFTRGFSRLSTFSESTGWGWLPQEPSPWGIIEMDNAGVVIRVKVGHRMVS